MRDYGVQAEQAGPGRPGLASKENRTIKVLEWEEARKWDRDTWEELAGKPRAWG